MITSESKLRFLGFLVGLLSVTSLAGCGTMAKSASDPLTNSSITTPTTVAPLAAATPQDQTALATIVGKSGPVSGANGNNAQPIGPASISPVSFGSAPSSIVFDGIDYPVSSVNNVHTVVFNAKTYTWMSSEVGGDGTYTYAFQNGATPNFSHSFQLFVYKTSEFLSNLEEEVSIATPNGTTEVQITMNGVVIYLNASNVSYAKFNLVNSTFAERITSQNNTTIGSLHYPFILTVSGRRYSGLFAVNNTLTDTSVSSPLICLDSNTNVGRIDMTSDGKIAVYLRNANGDLVKVVASHT